MAIKLFRFRRIEHLFLVGAFFSAMLNIILIFHVTNNKFHLPNEDKGGPTLTFKKSIRNHDFFIEVYRKNDIVSSTIQGYDGYGWESDHVEDLTREFEFYSQEHKIPMSDLTFIDIGANIGWYTFNMAALGVNVIAFEPMEDNLVLLKHSLSLAGNVENGISQRITLYEHGLGAADDMCFLYSDNGNVGDGHVKCVTKESDLNMEENYSVRGRVPIKRLDDIIDTTGMHVVAIKIDTEGFDSNVLKGGSNVILHSGADLILTEFVPENQREKGGDPVWFMTEVQKAGYRVLNNTYSLSTLYIPDEKMVNMNSYNGRMDSVVTFHSAPKANKTISAMTIVEGEHQYNYYNDYYMNRTFDDGIIGRDFGTSHEYYDENGTNPIIKAYNKNTTFAIEIYKSNDIVSSAIKNSWMGTTFMEGWESDVVQELNTLFEDYSKTHNLPLSKLTFIDIGANIGWLSLNMAALGVNVIAFEPMQENIQMLKRTLERKVNVESGISKRIKLFEHGLGSKDEICFIYSDDNNVGDGHVMCAPNENDLNIPANYTIHGRVPVKRLDDVINHAAMHIVAVKMDVEGFEGNVLEGGSNVLLKSDVEVIQTEFDPKWVKEKGGDPVLFMKRMMDAGYRIKKKEWGYMKKSEMLNMTNFGINFGDVTFHSNKMVQEFIGAV
jgi:FkbM family methyltransferase